MIRDREYRGPREATALLLHSNPTAQFALDPAGSDLSLENIGGVPFIQRADGVLVGDARGVIPSARLPFSANPANNDTITIGGASFVFKTTLIAPTTATQVKRGGNAAATLATLLDAINGVTNTNVVPATTPFAASLVADAATATSLRIRKASAQGGQAVAGTVSSTALAASITAGASAWNVADLSASGAPDAQLNRALVQLTITAAMITAGGYFLELPFTPTAFLVHVLSSAGVLRSTTDAFTISGNAIAITLAGGASPAIQAGDVVTVAAAG